MNSVLYINGGYTIIVAGLVGIYNLIAQAAPLVGESIVDTLINGGALAALVLAMWYVVKYQTKRLREENERNEVLRNRLEEELRTRLAKQEEEIRRLRERNQT